MCMLFAVAEETGFSVYTNFLYAQVFLKYSNEASSIRRVQNHHRDAKEHCVLND